MLRRLRVLLRSPALVYFAALLLSRGTAILLVPLYTRRLTLVEYGDYALGQTVLSILPTIMTLGLPGAISRFYFDRPNPDDGRWEAGTVARWHLLLAVISGVILELLVLTVWPARGGFLGGRWQLSCIVFASVGASVGTVPGTFMRTAQRPYWAALFQLIEFVCVITSAIVLVKVMNRGLGGAFEAYAIAYGIHGMVGTVFIFSLPGALSRPVLHRALSYTLPIVPHLFAGQLQNIADRWTLKATGLDAQLGPYALAGQVMAPATLLVGAFNDTDAPRMGEVLRSSGLPGIRNVVGRSRLRYLLVAALGAAMVIAATPIAKLLIAPRFHEALWLVPFLCISLLIESQYFPNLNVVCYASRTKLIAPVTFSAAALNVALNVVFIRYVGVGGAIAARAVSMAYRSAGMWLAARYCFARAQRESESAASHQPSDPPPFQLDPPTG